MAALQIMDMMNNSPHLLDSIGVHVDFAGNLGSEVVSYMQHVRRINPKRVLFERLAKKVRN